MDPTWYQYLLLFLIAAVAGAVNAVAGGGTLLTFPSLLWAGQLERFANATSTVALWPGQLGSLWGYRREIGRSHRAIGLLAVPSFLGGLAGALLLLGTNDETFAALVPYLILTATLLFAAQRPLSRWQRRRVQNAAGETEPPEVPAPDAAQRPEDRFPLGRWLVVLGFQFLVAVYGGYFGAGIGILMLASFAFLGFTNIHRMNGLKNISGMCINAVAAILFIVNGLVDWRLASLMAAGAILGGYAAQVPPAGSAKRTSGGSSSSSACS